MSLQLYTKKLSKILLFSSLLFTASVVSAGVVLTQIITNFPDVSTTEATSVSVDRKKIRKNPKISDANTNETSTISVDGKNMRIETLGTTTDSSAMIFLGETKSMLMIDHRKKQYSIMDEAKVEQLAGQMSNVNAEMEAALRNVPASQRAMVEAMMQKQMGNRMPKAVQEAPTEEPIIVPGPDNKTISGYATRHLQEKKGNELLKEYWVTDWGNIESGKEVRESFESMADLMEKLIGALKQLGDSPMMGMFNGMTSDIDEGAFKRLKELNAFPVSVITYKNGSPKNQTTLQSIEEQTLDPALFTPPKGYKKR